MKKHLILAAISAALVTAPFVDAIGKPSGFSSGKSSSSSSGASRTSGSGSSGASRASTSSGSSTSSASARRDSGSSGWGNSTRASVSATPAPAPKRDYGSSWGSATPARPAAAPRAAANDYGPASRVTPQLRQVEPTRVAPAAVPPSPAVSGFADTKSSSTKKKVAAVAGATALGGALYAAGANHEAVAAYQRSQEPMPVPVTAGTERTASTTAPVHVESRPTVHADTPSIHVPQQPQVIVVREAPRYNDHADDAYWYQRGRESGAREARVNNPVATTSTNTYGGALAEDSPVVQQAPRVSHVTQPAAPRSSSDDSSGVGSFILYTIVILMVLGALAYFVMQVLNSDPTRKSKPARRKSNYTL